MGEASGIYLFICLELCFVNCLPFKPTYTIIISPLNSNFYPLNPVNSIFSHDPQSLTIAAHLNKSTLWDRYSF